MGYAAKVLKLTKRITDTLQIARLSSGFAIFDDLEKGVAIFDEEASGPLDPLGKA